MFGSPCHRGAPRPRPLARNAHPEARVRHWRGLRCCAFVLTTLAWMTGCGENVFVGNWQLRSLNDAGVDLSNAPDAGRNEQAEHAEAARASKRKPVKDHSRPSAEKATQNR